MTPQFVVQSTESVYTSPPLVHLDISSISLALLVIGIYVCVVGQISYWLKERLYISSALISVLVGIGVGPIGANIISPLDWVASDVVARNEVTYQFMRLVIGIQVMFAGISLPAAYLKREWKSLLVLLIPIMTIAWLLCAGLILALIPGLTFVESLCISACITPTDPVLAASIVRGRYAEKHVSRNVRDILSAESGANDGLGFPFIFLPILLMQRDEEPLSVVMKEWFVSVWIYDIVLSIVLGFLIGFIARKTLKEAHRRQLVDHESFLAYGVGLAFLTLGLVGVLGSDDLLAAFIAGNSLTWKDFYRIESEDDTFQDVIDSLLNASVFIFIGTLIPWNLYLEAGVLAPWRIVVLAVLILIFKRLPWMIALHRFIPALDDRKEATFAGWYGPIGVSAVYYAMVALQELPAERVVLREVIAPLVLFLVFSSTTIHGISIPVTLFGPKVLTRTKSSFSRTSSAVTSGFGRLLSRQVSVTEISGPIAPFGGINYIPEEIIAKNLELSIDSVETDEGIAAGVIDLDLEVVPEEDVLGKGRVMRSRTTSSINLRGVGSGREVGGGEIRSPIMSPTNTRPSTPSGQKVEFILP